MGGEVSQPTDLFFNREKRWSRHKTHEQTRQSDVKTLNSANYRTKLPVTVSPSQLIKSWYLGGEVSQLTDLFFVREKHTSRHKHTNKCASQIVKTLNSANYRTKLPVTCITWPTNNFSAICSRPTHSPSHYGLCAAAGRPLLPTFHASPNDKG